MKVSLVFLLVALYGVAAQDSEEASQEESQAEYDADVEAQVDGEGSSGSVQSAIAAGVKNVNQIITNVEGAVNSGLDVKHQAFESGVGVGNEAAQAILGQVSGAVSSGLGAKISAVNQIADKHSELLESIKNNERLNAALNNMGSLGKVGQQALNGFLSAGGKFGKLAAGIETAKLGLMQKGIEEGINVAKAGINQGSKLAIAIHEKATDLGKQGVSAGMEAGRQGVAIKGSLSSNFAGLGSKVASGALSGVKGAIQSKVNAATELGSQLNGGASVQASASVGASSSAGASGAATYKGGAFSGFLGTSLLKG